MERKNLDGPKLARKYPVEFVNDDVTKMLVDFDAPNNSLYGGYRFKVAVELEEGYPRIAPIVYFKTKIWHPNIDFESGYPCVSALENENWNEGSRLEHIFSFVLPQLLCSPNFDDPYNQEASDEHKDSEVKYEQTVKDYCKKHADKI